MDDNQSLTLYRHLYNIHITFDALRFIVAIKDRGAITPEIAIGFFDCLRGEMDDDEVAIVQRYCEAIGEWCFDSESEAKAEAAYDEIALRVRVAKAQLLQRGIEWRRTPKEVPTIDALF